MCQLGYKPDIESPAKRRQIEENFALRGHWGAASELSIGGTPNHLFSSNFLPRSAHHFLTEITIKQWQITRKFVSSGTDANYGKSSGVDNNRAEILKHVGPGIIDTLTVVCQKSGPVDKGPKTGQHHYWSSKIESKCGYRSQVTSRYAQPPNWWAFLFFDLAIVVLSLSLSRCILIR